MGTVISMNEHAAPLTVSVQEAAKMLGISTWLYYEKVKTGDVPFIKIGRRIRVPLVQLERFLQAS